ncbi:peptidylprolyl isomerase [Achromobacter sp. AONIH1]|uniref:peptidylprolyl isomerase n=1 Tax=Achromobacter sp. AONIH1 TaxID=1758194 RepID=UPI000CD09A82|nr:peptidylprolyl isomerase [Achromobacter sp. AONIH1]AUT49296.1 peptidylprolyl isomerase [Achromobacter sp. AONIH1]
MNSILKQPTKVRIAAAVLLVAGAAGAVALMRGSPAQSSESKPAPQAAAKPAAAAAPAAGVKPPAVATLGAVQVDRDELQRQLQALPPQARAQLKDNRAGLDQWLRARLAEKALIEQARVQGWQDKPEVKRAFQAAQEQILMQSYLESVSRAPDDYPTEADLASAYERAKPQLAQPALYRVSQIFLPAPLGDAEAVAAARKQAQELVKRAQAPKADFAALARANSQDASSREQGGDIGFLPLAQLTPEMRPAVEQLKTGDVSAPVQSAAGFHILKLADLRPASVTPFDQVKGELRAALRSQRQELAARAYLEGLLNAGTVSIDGAALNAAFEQTAAAPATGGAVASAKP